MTTRELSGLTAFVTGSGRGLGRVMAERLAELEQMSLSMIWIGAGPRNMANSRISGNPPGACKSMVRA